MLDLSRIESVKIKYQFAENDFSELVLSVLEELGAAAKKRGAGLILEEKADLPKFVFDRDKIREVMINLIDNALKYSPRGGKILIREEVVSRSGKKFLRFSVQDQGIGIAPEDLGKLFTKFSRTPESQKIDPGGMGIGLYFVKMVVEDHGGLVGAESQGMGKGSTFFVELPLKN